MFLRLYKTIATVNKKKKVTVNSKVNNDRLFLEIYRALCNVCNHAQFLLLKLIIARRERAQFLDSENKINAFFAVIYHVLLYIEEK